MWTTGARLTAGSRNSQDVGLSSWALRPRLPNLNETNPYV